VEHTISAQDKIRHMNHGKYLVGCLSVSRYSLADEISDQNVSIATRNHHADRSKANSDFHDEELLLLSVLI